jgi:hypothetical protein
MDVVLAASGAKFISLFGYIDPGTGSLVFQVAAASLVSAGLFFKGWRAKASWMMSKVFGSRKSDAIEQHTESSEPQRKAA